MIFDHTHVNTLTVPSPGNPLGTPSTTPLDLTGGTDGIAPLIADGNPIYVEFEVTTSFVISGATAPTVMLGVLAASNTGLSADACALGFCGMTISLAGAIFSPGLTAVDLQLGARFHMVLPPFSRDIHTGASLINPQVQRYLGGVLLIPNYHVGGNTGFTAGAVKMRLTAGVQAQTNRDRLVASRMKVK